MYCEWTPYKTRADHGEKDKSCSSITHQDGARHQGPRNGTLARPPRPDARLSLPLGGPGAGMGLWRSLPVTLVFEAFSFVTILWLYLGTTRAKTESAITYLNRGFMCYRQCKSSGLTEVRDSDTVRVFLRGNQNLEVGLTRLSRFYSPSTRLPFTTPSTNSLLRKAQV
jgi:hypothetical protein